VVVRYNQVSPFLGLGFVVDEITDALIGLSYEGDLSLGLQRCFVARAHEGYYFHGWTESDRSAGAMEHLFTGYDGALHWCSYERRECAYHRLCPCQQHGDGCEFSKAKTALYWQWRSAARVSLQVATAVIADAGGADA
jgi:hypothetical protein